MKWQTSYSSHLQDGAVLPIYDKHSPGTFPILFHYRVLSPTLILGPELSKGKGIGPEEKGD